MTAETVYTIAKALSETERKLLYAKLQQDLYYEPVEAKNARGFEFTDAEALKCFYENLF